MITAKEARELSKNSNIDNVDDVLKQIELAAKAGNTKMFYYKLIIHPQIKKLKELGYKVSDLTAQREGVLYRISW